MNIEVSSDHKNNLIKKKKQQNKQRAMALLQAYGSLPGIHSTPTVTSLGVHLPIGGFHPQIVNET